jgi:hypothetical protein
MSLQALDMWRRPLDLRRSMRPRDLFMSNETHSTLVRAILPQARQKNAALICEISPKLCLSSQLPEMI